LTKKLMNISKIVKIWETEDFTQNAF